MRVLNSAVLTTQVLIGKLLEFRLEGIDVLDLFAELLKQTTMGIAPHGFHESLKHRVPFEREIITFRFSRQLDSESSRAAELTSDTRRLPIRS